ncbi:MAG TPA: hypothetical protein VFW34_06000 [Candidatus Rubrimentiphilum sp.]|nr:hypothetical protein [Candidatus Rubrimentiphilum sp.]
MGRRKALDTLESVSAEYLRERVREAKRIKGLTSQDLADRLGWDVRTLTNALASGRDLRVRTARPILDELYKARPHTPEAQIALRSAFPMLINTRRPTVVEPSALIHPNQITGLAEYLADEIGKQPTIGVKLRARIAQELVKALTRTSYRLARNTQRHMNMSHIGIETYCKFLDSFGYSQLADEHRNLLKASLAKCHRETARKENKK